MRTLKNCFVVGLSATAAAVASALPPACPGDTDGDRVVGLADVAPIINCWDQPAACDPAADLDQSGTIDLTDLAEVINNWGNSCPLAIVSLELAGNVLGAYPHFEFVQSFNRGAFIQAAIDPSTNPGAVGCAGQLYVVADKNGAGWTADPTLTDVRITGPQAFGPVSGANIQSNSVTLTDSNTITSGPMISTAYDVVIDFNSNGILDGGDYIDGLNGPGLWVVKDLTIAGPLAVTFANYTVTGVTAGFTGERVCYPTAIAGMGQLPLVVISHGNGHQYTWYDYLQSHLASHGFIVMSHQNDTVPGIETASTTTLQHTQAIIGQQATILGGVLNGHIDSTKIAWIGHSRGGEGVARGYDRIFDGTFIPTNYTLANIQVISSIAPTDFLGTASANPHAANYHLLYGAADGDVCGCASSDIADSFNLFERAEANRVSTYMYGVGHNEYNCCGFADATGPNLIGRAAAQVISRAYHLALLDIFINGSSACREYFWRHYESFRPPSALSTAVLCNELKDRNDASKFVIDDFQTNLGSTVASSGWNVTMDVLNFQGESIIMHDNNTTFTWPTSPADPFNGMTRGRTTDTMRGIVFDYTTGTPRFMQWTIPSGSFDTSAFKYLSFRACQGTRHTETIAELADLTFTVTITDVNGNSGSINMSAYGGGFEEPYQRTGEGTGTGWQNAFEVQRIRLSDFTTNGTNVDLTRIVSVRFNFGTGFGSGRGRVALDDIEFVKE